MVTPETVSALALALPGAQEVRAYGATAFRVRGTIFARFTADGCAVVLAVDPSDRAELLVRDPDTFAAAPGEPGVASLLVRLAGAAADELGDLLVEAWRLHAPRRLVAERDAAGDAETGDGGPPARCC